MADAGAAADRRLLGAQRSPDAVRQDRDRAVRALGGLLSRMSVEDQTSIVWDYAPAPESTDPLRLRDRYGLFIDGAFRDPADGRHVASVNPATEMPIAEMAWAGPA